MKSKFILSISLVLLVALVVVVSAKMTPYSDDSLSNKANYNIEVPVSEGWNLMASSPIWDEKFTGTSDSEIKQSNIKAVFYYFRHENKYLQMHPNNKEVENYLRNAQGKSDEMLYFAQSPVWVYSDKTGVLKYQRSDFPKWSDSSNVLSLSSGWNFVTITPEMVGESLNTLKGTCNIDKSYIWDSGHRWENVPFEGKFNNEVLGGNGMLIKVSSDCKLALGGRSSITPPPSIPVDCQDSDGGKNVSIKGSATGTDWQGKFASHEDACEETTYKNYLREYYCLDNIVQNEGNFCPSGTTCTDGACIK